VDISSDYCYQFNWDWTTCNFGDRAVYDLLVASTHYDYTYLFSELAVDECVSQSTTFQPNRGSDGDPIRNNFIWADIINVTGTMYVNGDRFTGTAIGAFGIDYFSCSLCSVQ
jgi:hypothetical protein